MRPTELHTGMKSYVEEVYIFFVYVTPPIVFATLVYSSKTHTHFCTSFSVLPYKKATHRERKREKETFITDI